MASEHIKSTNKMRKKNYKAMTEQDGLESKIKSFFWINEKALDNIGKKSGQVTFFHIKTRVLKNVNHQM